MKDQCVTRLLHVGMRIAVVLSNSRGSPNLHGQLQNVLVDLVGLIGTLRPQHYDPFSVDADPGEGDVLDDGD